MERLTRHLDNYPCRVNRCKAEEWMESIYGECVDFDADICEDCPFESYINKLAEYEDMAEQMEDDLK